MMRRVSQFIDSINRWVGNIIALLIIVLVFEVVVGVIARYGFNHPFVWSQETASFINGIYIVMGGGYALLLRSHVNVDIVYRLFSPRGRALADIFTAVLFFFFVVLVIWQGGEMAWESITLKEHLATAWHAPVYPFKIFVPLGGFLLLLQGMSKLLQDFALLKDGEEHDSGGPL